MFNLLHDLPVWVVYIKRFRGIQLVLNVLSYFHQFWLANFTLWACCLSMIGNVIFKIKMKYQLYGAQKSKKTKCKMYKVSGVMLEENCTVTLSHPEMMLLPQAKYLQHVLVCAFSNTRPLWLKKSKSENSLSFSEGGALAHDSSLYSDNVSKSAEKIELVVNRCF